MKILQLCCFTNFWSPAHTVDSWDIKHNKNVFDLTPDHARNFDLIISAPPCTQFTKANCLHWLPYPALSINLVKHILEVCRYSGNKWLLENPPGRIEKLIPELTAYRIITYRCVNSIKEYVLYGNVLLIDSIKPRFGKGKPITNLSKRNRDAWQPDLVKFIENNLTK
jgi:hypothetical protein